VSCTVWNRFSGFLEMETAEAVKIAAGTQHTQLEQGVNETAF
jgi:hypothetical protein